ncbi:MAG: DUF952 domain-containing protein [Planctomycetaceae bacterium]
MIYRLSERADWRAAQTSGLYLSADLGTEGFIHASTAQQVMGVAFRYYQSRTDLVLIEIDELPLGDLLRWEASTGGELFPHVYGPIPLQAVRRISSFPEVSDSSQTAHELSQQSVSALAWQPWPPPEFMPQSSPATTFNERGNA